MTSSKSMLTCLIAQRSEAAAHKANDFILRWQRDEVEACSKGSVFGALFWQQSKQMCVIVCNASSEWAP